MEEGTMFISAELTRNLNRHDFIGKMLWGRIPRFSDVWASNNTNVT